MDGTCCRHPFANLDGRYLITLTRRRARTQCDRGPGFLFILMNAFLFRARWPSECAIFLPGLSIPSHQWGWESRGIIWYAGLTVKEEAP